MARSTKGPAAVSSIQERLTEAAQAFVQEILRALSVSTLAELSLLTGGRRDELVQIETPPPPAPKASKAPREPKAQAPAPTPVPTKVAKAPPARQKKKPNPRISAVRKEAGTKPVTCPVPGCAEPGIRSKMNFCRPHAESLPRPDRVRMRQEQRLNKQNPVAAAPVPAEKPGKKAAKKKA